MPYTPCSIALMAPAPSLISYLLPLPVGCLSCRIGGPVTLAYMSCFLFCLYSYCFASVWGSLLLPLFLLCSTPDAKHPVKTLSSFKICLEWIHHFLQTSILSITTYILGKMTEKHAFTLFHTAACFVHDWIPYSHALSTHHHFKGTFVLCSGYAEVC